MHRSTKTYGNEVGLHLNLQYLMNEIGFMTLVVVSGLKNIYKMNLTIS